MQRLRDKKGITLAEVLIVIGIIAVLAGVVFISVFSYLRSMTKLEYDGYAKEIFVAAQNHLTAAHGMEYLGRTEYGTEDLNESGVYYYVQNSGGSNPISDETTIMSMMLPYAAVDETIRVGGSYIVRWHKDSGQVLDVFYWSESARRFAHTYSNADYEPFLENRDNKNALKTYGSDRSVIGWFGGASAANLTQGEPLNSPTLTLVNAERLYATVKENNESSAISTEGYTLKLIVTGKTSGCSREIVLDPSNLPSNVTYDSSTKTYMVILDDITTSGSHFYNLFCTGEGALIPGEDVTVRAVSYNSKVLTNVAYSTEQTANSLFGNDTSGTTAAISNIRHLENLAADTSRVNSTTLINYSNAVQKTDLDWNEFVSAVDSSDIHPISGTATSSSFLPVTPGYALNYDGGSHSISNVVVSYGNNAGLFGSLNNSTVSHVKLNDFTVTGTGTYDAGILAGSINNSRVTDVLAIGDSASVAGGANVGGLIGYAVNSTVEKSAAAIMSVRSADGSAGGLIGYADTGTVVSACYAGGRTDEGEYYEHDGSGQRTTPIYNVIADGASLLGTSAAGGLVGTFNGTRIEYSYSTCSASGDTAGGFVGSATAGSFTSCYATGLVDGSTKGAFIGSASGVSASGCLYYEAVNEYAPGFTYLGAVGSGSLFGVSALDATAKTYNDFVGAQSGWTEATPVDPALNMYFAGTYPLKTVSELGASGVTGFASKHFGDWPAPEIHVINN